MTEQTTRSNKVKTFTLIGELAGLALVMGILAVALAPRAFL